MTSDGDPRPDEPIPAPVRTRSDPGTDDAAPSGFGALAPPFVPGRAQPAPDMPPERPTDGGEDGDDIGPVDLPFLAVPREEETPDADGHDAAAAGAEEDAVVGAAAPGDAGDVVPIEELEATDASETPEAPEAPDAAAGEGEEWSPADLYGPEEPSGDREEDEADAAVEVTASADPDEVADEAEPTAEVAGSADPDDAADGGEAEPWSTVAVPVESADPADPWAAIPREVEDEPAAAAAHPVDDAEAGDGTAAVADVAEATGASDAVEAAEVAGAADATEVAEVLEALADGLREGGAEAIRAELASTDRLRSLVAALVAGYLAAGE